jgi:MFS transporter, FSR family, fosmidomycin resistance protein
MSTNRRGIALISSAHVVDDIYQGVVPALLPFLVLERRYSYAAVAGLVLAATVFSSVAQPFFGWWADRSPRRWLVAAGMVTAGVGVALSGFTGAYPLTWLALAVSGIGVAAFHPEAARAARQAAANSTRAMSVFAVGGNVGYALGPIIATPVLLAVGLRGTALLALPATAMALLLALRLTSVLDGTAVRPRTHLLPTGDDDWRTFGWLTAVVMTRSVLFFGMSAFVALYFLSALDASHAVAAAALSVFLVSGILGTVLGGWLADRLNKLVSIRVGFALMLPALAGFLLATNVAAAMVFVALAGIAVYLPFSVFVMLGQDYLPQRIGTASGVTVGLAVTAGGLVSPLLGALADHTDLRTALMTLLALPAVGLLFASRLRHVA